jgi:pimeloyl-ACP methyl ester carboxylesterase
MTNLSAARIALSTGITLNVQTGGPREEEAIILLHGFPESHRTWRDVAPALAEEHFVVAPDQRGFGASDKPEGVENYRADRAIADVIALADALGIGRFILVGHDWGGAIAWGTAIRHPERVARLVIVNAPHPSIFQRSLILDPGQRAASQYMSFFRTPGAEAAIEGMGLAAFFDKTFGSVADLTKVSAEERQVYLDDWSQPGALTTMLNWYRASDIVVPVPGEEAAMPVWADGPFPPVAPPTLVVWGLGDRALLPLQLEGLDDLVDDLTIDRVEDAGHFLPWEKPEAVVEAIRTFLKAR